MGRLVRDTRPSTVTSGSSYEKHGVLPSIVALTDRRIGRVLACSCAANHTSIGERLSRRSARHHRTRAGYAGSSFKPHPTGATSADREREGRRDTGSSTQKSDADPGWTERGEWRR